MYGALLASQTGRDVDIVNSFELPLSTDGEAILDKAFLSYKLDQCKNQCVCTYTGDSLFLYDSKASVSQSRINGVVYTRSHTYRSRFETS